MPKEKKLKIFFIITTITYGLVLFYLGFSVGREENLSVDNIKELINKERDPNELVTVGIIEKDEQTDFSPFWRIWNILDKKFTSVSTSTSANISSEDKVIAAARGLVAAHKDPYTTLFVKEQSKNLKDSIKGSFYGIGAQIQAVSDSIVVIYPLKNSPAKNAGLKSGDVILKIDDNTTNGLSTREAVNLIRGEKGSSVTLTILRENTKMRTVTITRDEITIPSTASTLISRTSTSIKKTISKIKSKNLNENTSKSIKTSPDINYPNTNKHLPEIKSQKEEDAKIENFFLLQLANFSKTSPDDFLRRLKEFKKTENNMLIIDLRNNQGGLLESAVEIAGYFLPQDTLVVSEYQKKRDRNKKYLTRSPTIFQKNTMPKIAILVNKYTASSAEILAASLREYNLAIIVGEKTFGKGSVQELVDITDTISLKLTIAQWYTPSGKSLNKNGLEPDYYVEDNWKDGKDTILEKAITVLQNND